MRVREHIMAMGRAFFLAFTASASAVMIVTMGEVMVAGQASPPAVFTIQQATAGKAGYAKNCASCHSPDLSGNGEIPALAGPAFKDTWGDRTTKEFFDYMSAAMPYGGPSLSTDAYTEIIAYILQTNGAVAGESALTASTSVQIGDLAVSPAPASH
jgi:mono/diheme cytochrome c family protein